MSDEDSFVILSTSPSLNANASSCSTPYCSLGSLKQHELQSAAKSLLPANNLNILSKDGVIKTNVPPTLSGATNDHTRNEHLSGNNSPKTSVDSNGSVVEKSLASRFILGEIDADVLKSSVYSQFPSLCSMEACAEDVVKLQQFMSEYRELKNVMTKVNSTMKQFYTKTQQWKQHMAQMEDNFKQELQECQSQIATLRNHNLELKQELKTKSEQIQICENLRQKDHNELVQVISEKTAQINNMRVQIEKLESEQLKSFEYIAKNTNDSKNKPDYVDRLEHQRVTKEHERKLSALLAENLELKDLQKQYKDEITCLSVNLAAAEELINKSRADINLLKAKDMKKTETFNQYELEREKMKEELLLLREQVNIYCKDFQIERAARQDLAGEKDQLLHDLRLLQRRNQELLEQLQKDCQAYEKRLETPNPDQMSQASARSTMSQINETQPKDAIAPPRPPSDEVEETSSAFTCPICYKTEKSYRTLEQHVSLCLDK